MRLKTKIAPSKKMQKPAKRVAQRKYAQDDEEYDREENVMANKMRRKPAGIAEALNKAKMGYSKKPRVKPSKKR